MILHLLPHRTGGAAENMALDFLLLQRYPAQAAARFRHYSWRTPSVTFGYSQKWELVRSRFEPEREFCRRPTGGGIVDHTADWTYALVVPPGHALHRETAPVAYYLVHQALCDALSDQGQDVMLQPDGDGAPTGGGVCFLQAEPHDIVVRSTRAKAAGAALKRNKNGLLLQGSIDRTVLPGVDWALFEEQVAARLAECLAAAAEPHPWPSFDPDEESHLIDQFSASEWNQRR